MKKWQIERIRLEDASQYLVEGWEPFAIISKKEVYGTYDDTKYRLVDYLYLKKEMYEQTQIIL